MAFWRLYYHLVWATKNREHLIGPETERVLHDHLMSKAAELDVHVYAIGGWYDHVHLVVSIPPKHAVADVVKHLKGASSYEVNRLNPGAAFAWQRGYGALSVGERQRPVAEQYVMNQKEHHQTQTALAWAERTADLDEGPDGTGLPPDGMSSAVREGAVFYGDAPF